MDWHSTLNLKIVKRNREKKSKVDEERLSIKLSTSKRSQGNILVYVNKERFVTPRLATWEKGIDFSHVFKKKIDSARS